MLVQKEPIGGTSFVVPSRAFSKLEWEEHGFRAYNLRILGRSVRNTPTCGLTWSKKSIQVSTITFYDFIL